MELGPGFDNAVSEGVLQAILEDDVDALTGYCTNAPFGFNNYLLPRILSSKPPVISVCAFFGAVECLRYLIQSGADTAETDVFGRTPIFFAMASKNMDVVRCLAVNDNVYEARDREGNFPVHVACEYGFLDAVKTVYLESTTKLTLSQPNFQRCVPLLKAAECGHIEILEFLKEIEINLLDSDARGWNGLFYACYGGYVEAAKWFIDIGVDIDKMGHEGDTALSVACANGNMACVKFLIESGSKRYKKQNQRVTPLVEAAGAGHVDIVDYLISLECDPHVQNSGGVTPLREACGNYQFGVIQYYLKKGYIKSHDYEYCTSACLSKIHGVNFALLESLLLNAKRERRSLNLVVNFDNLVKNILQVDDGSDEYHQFFERVVSFLLGAGCQFFRAPPVWVRTHLRKLLPKISEEAQEMMQEKIGKFLVAEKPRSRRTSRKY